MKRRTLIVAACVISAGALAIHKLMPKQTEQPVEVADNASVSSTTTRLDSHHKTVSKKIRLASETSKQIAQTKVRLRLSMLAALNPELQAANPGLDLSSLKPGDPVWAQVKVPAGLPLIVLKDGSCGRQAVSGMGALSDDRLATSLETESAPSFVSYKTDRLQTIGEMEADASKSDCVHGVFANGTIDSVRLPPGTTSLDGLLDPADVKNAPKIYDVKAIALDGKHAYQASVDRGAPEPYQIFMAGSTPERFGVVGSENPTEPVDSGRTLMNGAGEIWFLPFPQDASPTEQIADMNNAVLNAIAHGAHVVLVPAVDPNVLLPAAQLAAANGVQIYEVPRDSAPLPTGIVDAQPVRMPSSTAYVPEK